jgi:hypothetical protein
MPKRYALFRQAGREPFLCCEDAAPRDARRDSDWFVPAVEWQVINDRLKAVLAGKGGK